jgi:hypothetical protein
MPIAGTDVTPDPKFRRGMNGRKVLFPWVREFDFVYDEFQGSCRGCPHGGLSPDWTPLSKSSSASTPGRRWFLGTHHRRQCELWLGGKIAMVRRCGTARKLKHLDLALRELQGMILVDMFRVGSQHFSFRSSHSPALGDKSSIAVGTAWRITDHDMVILGSGDNAAGAKPRRWTKKQEQFFDDLDQGVLKVEEIQLGPVRDLKVHLTGYLLEVFMDSYQGQSSSWVLSVPSDYFEVGTGRITWVEGRR